MPLFATRPEVLPLISVSPTGERLLTANFAGSANERMRRPLSRSNWYTNGPYSSVTNTELPSFETRMPSGSRRPLFALVEGFFGSKLSERPLK